MERKREAIRLTTSEAKEELLQPSSPNELRTTAWHSPGKCDLVVTKKEPPMRLVRQGYRFYLKYVNVILSMYRTYNTYQLFKETSITIIEQGKGKKYPTSKVYLHICNLLTLSRLIIHNRIRRSKPKEDLLRKDSIKDENLKFQFTYEEYRPPEQFKVKESELFRRISRILDEYKSREGLKIFSEARQIIMAHAVNVSYKSIMVFSNVANLLFYFQHAIEDAIESESLA